MKKVKRAFALLTILIIAGHSVSAYANNELIDAWILELDAAYFEDAISFNKLSDAILFIETCLDNGNEDELYNTCIFLRQNTSGNIHRFFAIIKKYHEQTPLHVLYAGTTFPQDRSQVALGGHGGKLGYIHIDFIKRDGKWYLTKIWMCK